MPSIKDAFWGTVFTALFWTPALAAEPVQQHNSNAVWFENWIGLSNATMTISAPDGKVTTVHAKQGTPVFKLTSSEAQDGVYRYELSAATEEETEIVNQIDNGRGDAQRSTENVPYYHTGHFVVAGGVIITPEVKEEKREKDDE